MVLLVTAFDQFRPNFDAPFEVRPGKYLAEDHARGRNFGELLGGLPSIMCCRHNCYAQFRDDKSAGGRQTWGIWEG